MSRAVNRHFGLAPFTIVQYNGLQEQASFEMVKPVVVAAVANLIMAAPSFAEAG